VRIPGPDPLHGTDLVWNCREVPAGHQQLDLMHLPTPVVIGSVAAAVINNGDERAEAMLRQLRAIWEVVFRFPDDVWQVTIKLPNRSLPINEHVLDAAQRRCRFLTAQAAHALQGVDRILGQEVAPMTGKSKFVDEAEIVADPDRYPRVALGPDRLPEPRYIDGLAG